MELATPLLIALLGVAFISLIWTAILGGPWSVRPMIAVAFAIAIWIGLAGPLKLG